MAAVLKNGEPSPFVQPLQAKAELDDDQAAGIASVAHLHVAERGGRQDRAGIVTDQASGLQAPDVRTSDVSARVTSPKSGPG